MSTKTENSKSEPNTPNSEVNEGGNTPVEPKNTVSDTVENSSDPAAVKEPVVTEQDFQKIIKERVAREAAKTQKVQADFENAQKLLETALAEAAAYEEEKTSLSNKAADAEKKLMKLNLSVSEDVPLSVIEALRGETEEELKVAIAAIKDSSQNKKQSYNFSSKEYSTGTSPVELILQKMKNS